MGERRRSYAELARDAAVFSSYLTKHSVSTGDVVSVQLPNVYEAVVTTVAAQSLGAVVNPLLPSYRSHELLHVFRMASPRVVVTPDRYRGFAYRPMVEEVAARSGLDLHHVEFDLDRSTPLAEVVDAPRTSAPALVPASAASAVSELIFTSGTESVPKAIMHTEETANAGAHAVHDDLGLAAGDVVWTPSPVGHSTGLNFGVRIALGNGMRLVLQDIWDPFEAIRLVREEGCTYTLAATTFLQDLVNACSASSTTLPMLGRFGCGGAPVPAELVERADALGIGVLRLYGSTEVLSATWNRPDSPLAKRMHTDGLPLSNYSVEIRDESGVALAAGCPGELHVRGPSNSVGLLDDPERTAATYLPGGWVRSGDVAVLDEDGYLAIVGRKKEIIIRGGLNIAPREIEDLLCSMPEVERAAVVGLRDNRLGERCCACVVTRGSQGLSFETITQRLRELGLATHKLPERLIVLPELPTTASGKVKKHELIKTIEDDPDFRSKWDRVTSS